MLKDVGRGNFGLRRYASVTVVRAVLHNSAFSVLLPYDKSLCNFPVLSCFKVSTEGLLFF